MKGLDNRNLHLGHKSTTRHSLLHSTFGRKARKRSAASVRAPGDHHRPFGHGVNMKTRRCAKVKGVPRARCPLQPTDRRVVYRAETSAISTTRSIRVWSIGNSMKASTPSGNLQACPTSNHMMQGCSTGRMPRPWQRVSDIEGSLLA